MRKSTFALRAVLLAAGASGSRSASTDVAPVKPMDLGAQLGAAIGRDSVVVTVWQPEHRVVALVRESMPAADTATVAPRARKIAVWLWTHYGEHAGMRTVEVSFAPTGGIPPNAAWNQSARLFTAEELRRLSSGR
jgi:hypothetical protein